MIEKLEKVKAEDTELKEWCDKEIASWEYNFEFCCVAAIHGPHIDEQQCPKAGH